MRSSERAFLLVALAGGVMYALALGNRQAQALFIAPINTETGVGYAMLSFAFGVAQLMWGVAQFVGGGLADRFGARPVMISGVVLLAAATALTPLAASPVALIVLIGILGALGAGSIGPAMVLSAASRWIPEAKRSVASGIINAGGSFGQFSILPLVGLGIGLAGWQPTMVMLGLTMLLAVPALLYVTRGTGTPPAAPAAGPASLGRALSEAMRDPSFLLLNAGFFTCGFHVAFIATHLPGVVAFCQLDASVAAWSLSIIGLFNMLGSLWIGKWVQTRRMKMALAGLYFARALLILAFYLAPKTPLVFFLFSAGVGFTYLSTVPPTIGLVAKLLGARYLATLFGVVMMSHQVGAFLGAWLGGKAFEASGSYDWMWFADIALCLMAAAVHLPIREARPRVEAAAA